MAAAGKRPGTAVFQQFFAKPTTKRRKNIVRIHRYIVVAVTTVVLIGEFWPASYFTQWNFSNSFPGDAPTFFGTYIFFSVALFPLRPLMLSWFGQPKEKTLRDSGLLDD